MIDVQEILRQAAAVDLTPLLLALVLGGAIGLEREVHGRAAGLRTHVLVCLTSTVLVLASREVSQLPGSGVNIVFDPQRLAAGIVTGIGFLGAAAVIRSGDIVRGVTTGACVWSVAGLGVVIGGGSYGLAVLATLFILAVVVLLDWVTGAMSPVIYRRIVVRGPGNGLAAVSDAASEILKSKRIRIQDASGRQTSGSEPFKLVFHVRCRHRQQAPAVLEEIAAVDGVASVEWVGLTN
ncbi:MAG: MgtC/SapB family protein [Deltaproteobacteria bacterium]